MRATLRTFGCWPPPCRRVRRILKEVAARRRPSAAAGSPAGRSSRWRRCAACPALALEADAHLGVANRLLRPFVRRFCLSFPIAGLGPPKYVVTGRPLGPAQLAADAERGRGAPSSCGRTCRSCSPSAAARARRASTAPASRPSAAGDARLPARARLRAAQPRRRARRSSRRSGERFERYRLVPYTDRLAAAMAAADLVVARSGGSVAELAALGRPAILVPYPYATADHQRKNARVDGRRRRGAPGRRRRARRRAAGARWSPSCSATASGSRAMAAASAALGARRRAARGRRDRGVLTRNEFRSRAIREEDEGRR